MADQEGGEVQDQSKEYVDQSANSEVAAEEINNAFEVPADCNTPLEVFNLARSQGLVLPEFEKLENAVEDLKNAVSADILYNGSTEKIHDNKVIIQHANQLGIIGEKLNEYIEVGTQITELPETFEGPLKILIESIDTANTPETKSALQAFIRLHFHCFKNCYKTDCLTMD
jgi:hypothetical protein